MKIITIELTEQQAQVVLGGLAELPIKVAASTYEHVYAALMQPSDAPDEQAGEAHERAA